jgi:hypothetical protein
MCGTLFSTYALSSDGRFSWVTATARDFGF